MGLFVCCYYRSQILNGISSGYAITLGLFVAGIMIGIVAKPQTGSSALGTRAMSDGMFVA